MSAELLNKAACRRYGLTRADVDRLFDHVPLFSPRPTEAWQVLELAGWNVVKDGVKWV